MKQYFNPSLCLFTVVYSLSTSVFCCRTQSKALLYNQTKGKATPQRSNELLDIFYYCYGQRLFYGDLHLVGWDESLEHWHYKYLDRSEAKRFGKLSLT